MRFIPRFSSVRVRSPGWAYVCVRVCVCVSSQLRKGPWCPGLCLEPQAAPGAGVRPSQLAPGLRKALLLRGRCAGPIVQAGTKTEDLS